MNLYFGDHIYAYGEYAMPPVWFYDFYNQIPPYSTYLFYTDLEPEARRRSVDCHEWDYLFRTPEEEANNLYTIDFTKYLDFLDCDEETERLDTSNDYSRFMSFLERGDSFFTPWNQNPKPIGRNNGIAYGGSKEYMKFQQGSFFSFDVRSLFSSLLFRANFYLFFKPK